MSIEPALRSELINDESVAALIGTRVYPMRLPQGYVLPAISYQRISAPRSRTTKEPTGRVSARFQIDCWAGSYSQVLELAGCVRMTLDNFRGMMGTGSTSLENVGTITIIGERDWFNEVTEENRVILEFLIPYIEETR